MPNLPRKLSGNSPMAAWCNALIDYLASLRPRESPGVLTSQTTRGTFREAKPGGRKPQSGTGFVWG